MGESRQFIALRLERGSQKPATSLGWFEIARFVNWFNVARGAPPASKFSNINMFECGNLVVSVSIRIISSANPLPSMEEWYMAEYYDRVAGVYWDYPTGSDDPPTPVASGTDISTAVYDQIAPADVMLADYRANAAKDAAGNAFWESLTVELPLA